MTQSTKQSFAFLVLAYNHQKYIVEHLESIKYLMQTYALNIDVDIIINDDFSRDLTRLFIDTWLLANDYLFRSVKKLYNEKNIGTCESIVNMLSVAAAERFKLTAGDDVYSFENIFELTELPDGVGLLSGFALDLRNGVLSERKIESFLAIATQVIYSNKQLLMRFKHLSFNNAPNITYSADCLKDPRVLSYLKKFDVVEDWPLQIAISRFFPGIKFELVNKVFVYYRRTPGSTYIVANDRFNSDKINIYNDLIRHEVSAFEKLRLYNRKFCFQFNNRILNKLLNIDLYIFIFLIVTKLAKIFSLFHRLELNTLMHTLHFELIKKRALSFIQNERRDF